MGSEITPEPEYLKLIQGVVERMARNSFAVKTASVTVIGAFIGIAGTTHERPFAFAALYLLATFALLDAYYLSLERAYIALYENAVVNRAATWELRAEGPTVKDVATSLTSPSILLLHVPNMIAVVLCLALVQ